MNKALRIKNTLGLVAPVLVSALFIASLWWRASTLGFYSDDWILLSNTDHSPTTLVAYLQANWYARPTYGLIAWAINLLAEGSPTKWQIASSAITWLSAIIVYKIVVTIATSFNYNKQLSKLGGYYGAISLIVSPWMLAVFVWSTGAITLCSFILFGLGFLTIEQSEDTKKKIIGSLFVLSGFLAYEAYWFAFIPFLFVSTSFKTIKIFRTLARAAWYAIPLCMTLIYQRILIPLIAPGQIKNVSPDIELIKYNITHIDYFISQAISPLSSLALYLSLTILICTLVLIKTISLERVAKVILTFAIGYFFTAAIHGAAGYGLSGTGVMSRTIAAPGVYYAILIGLLGVAAASRLATNKEDTKRNFLGIIPFFVILLLLSFSTANQIDVWTKNMKESNTVLHVLTENIDRTYLREPTTDITIVVQIDGDPNGEIFGASWELSGGIAHASPELLPRKGVWFLTARQGAWSTQWSGDAVIQKTCIDNQANEIEHRSSNAAPIYYRISPKEGIVVEAGRLTKNNLFGCNNTTPILSSL